MIFQIHTAACVASVAACGTLIASMVVMEAPVYLGHHVCLIFSLVAACSTFRSGHQRCCRLFLEC